MERAVLLYSSNVSTCVYIMLLTRECFSACHQSKCKCLKLRYQTKHELTTGGRMHKFHSHNYANTLSNVNYL